MVATAAGNCNTGGCHGKASGQNGFKLSIFAFDPKFEKQLVDYHGKEGPGTIVVDSDNHYLYLVQANGKAIRYGVTVGEEALAPGRERERCRERVRDLPR